MEDEKLNLILEKIKKIEEKIEDNNNILHSERNAKRLGKVFIVIKWIVIIAIGIVSWAYFQPIYKNILKTYNNISEVSNDVNNSTKGLRNNLKQIEKINPSGLLDTLKDKF